VAVTKIFGLIGVVAMGLIGNAYSLSYSVDLIQVYSGTAPSSVGGPWLRATFEDVAGGKVRLTMEALNLSANEIVGTWSFNLNPALSVSALSFNLDPSDPGLASPDIAQTPSGNDYKAGPEKYFDIQFANETANNPDRFIMGEKLIFDVGIIGGELEANDFLFVNQQKSGNTQIDDDWYSAAHIQGITGGKSGWIGAATFNETPAVLSVPDSGRTVFLFAGAFAGLIAWRRSQKRGSR
jgi:hypothetical protein